MATGGFLQCSGAATRLLVAPDTPFIAFCILLVWRGGVMDLYLFRLSLKERQQLTLFDNVAESNQSREDWIREFCSVRREFLHAKNAFTFVPEKASPHFPLKLIAGWIARSRVLQEWTPPDEGLSPTHHESWRVAFILIDPTEHQDGQKIALENHADIGGAYPIIKSLVRSMSGLGPYSAEVFPIIQEASFWRFAEKHSFVITHPSRSADQAEAAPVGAARTAWMASSGPRPLRRPVATTERMSA